MTEPNLLLLHGGLGSRSQFSPLIPLLRDRFQMHTLDFEGHGGSPSEDRPFRLNHFAENVLAYLDENSIDQGNIFGHSMGGHVGLYLAKAQPRRVSKVFTLGTKFVWTPELAAREATFLDADFLIKKVPHFAGVLEERHGASRWREVVEKTREAFMYQGKNNPVPVDELKQVSCEVRIGVGDRDRMVTIEESLEAYRALPRGELQIFPRTPHPLEEVPFSNLAHALMDFFR